MSERAGAYSAARASEPGNKVAPFTVLHVCMGNICRSPMAERLLGLEIRAAAGDRAGELVHSESAGTGGWHAGEPMNPPAARQVRARGGDPGGFAARRLRAEHIDAADLVLTATAEQQEYVVELRPEAASRTFVLKEFGRLLATVDEPSLPGPGVGPDEVYARGVAIVEAVNAGRGVATPVAGDDLDDPWGRGDQWFSRVADEIGQAVRPFATLLLRAGRQ